MPSAQSGLAVEDGVVDPLDPVDPLGSVLGVGVLASFVVLAASPDDGSDEPSPPSVAEPVVAGFTRRSFLAQPEPL
jgi:hypothetical protein